VISLATTPSYLRGNVVGSSAECSFPLSVVVDLGGETEVPQLDLHLIVEEDVAQLQVPVDDLVLVQVLAPQQYLTGGQNIG
jgi:hypothetical protein